MNAAIKFETKSDNTVDATPFDEVKNALAGLKTDVETKLAPLADITKRLDTIEAKSNRPHANDNRTTEPTAERKAFGTYLRFGNSAPSEELKTLTVAVDAQGGYLAPPEMATEFFRDLVLASPIRAYASVRTTSSSSVIYPKRTGVTNAVWKGEITAQTASEPTFGQAELVTKELATYVDVSNQLLADSGGQAEAEVRLALAEDFARKEGIAFLSGDGVLAPEGVLTNPEIAYTANGSTTVLSTDAMIAMMYSMPAEYRNAGAWLMNSTSLAAIRKLKATDGTYLWQPGLQAGQPETILGRPVIEAVDAADFTANAFPIVFGDWSGYRIVDRIGLSVLVNPFLLATNGITRIHATRRLAAGVVQAAKFRKLKMSTT